MKTQKASRTSGYLPLARWRNGWELVTLGDQTYLRRAFNGTYKVIAKRDGYNWAVWYNGERVYPDRLGTRIG